MLFSTNRGTFLDASCALNPTASRFKIVDNMRGPEKRGAVVADESAAIAAPLKKTRGMQEVRLID